MESKDSDNMDDFDLNELESFEIDQAKLKPPADNDSKKVYGLVANPNDKQEWDLDFEIDEDNAQSN
jgi:hypothetical protein